MGRELEVRPGSGLTEELSTDQAGAIVPIRTGSRAAEAEHIREFAPNEHHVEGIAASIAEQLRRGESGLT